MIKLYFAPLTRSIRIKWLLDELGLDHELAPVTFNRDGSRGFAQDTPTGKLPYLEDGRVGLSESGAIVQYLLEQYGEGRLQPKIGSPERTAFLHWLHFTEATAAIPINTIVWLSIYRDDAEQHMAVIEAARQTAAQIFDQVEEAVSGRSFLVGDTFSAADIMMGFTLWSAKALRVLTDAHPETLRYIDELCARPAFAGAITAGW